MTFQKHRRTAAFTISGLLLASGLLSIAANSATAETTTAVAPSTINYVTAQKPGEINVASLIGTAVTNDANETIGNINYVIMDANGQVTTIAVGVGGFVGVGEKNVGVPADALKLSEDANGQRIAKLQATKEQLTAAPDYQWINKPMGVRVEETIKNTADKIKDATKSATEKASEAIGSKSSE